MKPKDWTAVVLPHIDFQKDTYTFYISRYQSPFFTLHHILSLFYFISVSSDQLPRNPNISITSFNLGIDIFAQQIPPVWVSDLDSSGQMEGLTVRLFRHGQHGFLLLETFFGEQKVGPIVVVSRAALATLQSFNGQRSRHSRSSRTRELSDDFQMDMDTRRLSTPVRNISTYPVHSPQGAVVLEVGLIAVAVWDGFLRFDQSMHTVDAIDLLEGVAEGIDEDNAAFLGEIITGGVIDLHHDLTLSSAQVLLDCHTVVLVVGGGRTHFLAGVDTWLRNGVVRIGDLDNSGQMEGLTVRRFRHSQHGFLLLETLVRE